MFCFIQNLLEVVHDVFEEQTSLESVILKIMQRAQRLLKCERAAVLLLDDNTTSQTLPNHDVKFSKLFELNTPLNNGLTTEQPQTMQSRYIKENEKIFNQNYYN